MINYRLLPLSEWETLAPQIFALLSGNMLALHPEERLSDDDFRLWLWYQTGSFAEKRFLLAEDGPRLAGYLQYSVRQAALLIEEIEIAPEYQVRFGILRGLFRELWAQLPPGVETVSAFIHRDNLRSARLAEGLGLRPAGETASGKSLRYAGTLAAVRKAALRRPPGGKVASGVPRKPDAG